MDQPWGIGEFDKRSGKCGSLKLGTPPNLKILDSVSLYQNLYVLVIIWTMHLITSLTFYLCFYRDMKDQYGDDDQYLLG